MDLTNALVELYRRTATDLPTDVEKALIQAREKEENNSIAYDALNSIIENIRIAREKSIPLCQDTGTPIFYVKIPKGTSVEEIKQKIIGATKIATKEIPLRPNSVDSFSGKNSGDNTGINFPVIYFEEWDKDSTSFDLLLKGGGSENVGKTYSLPNAELNAGRDLNGVRKCIIDAVFSAQGNGCPPGIVAVCIGGSKDVVSFNSKKLLLKKLDERNPVKELAEFEEKLCRESNSLGIGTAGLGGKTSMLGIKVLFIHRHPASFFVDVAYCCWACRRRKMIFKNGEAEYE